MRSVAVAETAIATAFTGLAAWRSANPNRARSSWSNLATSFWSMKVTRNNPKKMAPTGIATVQPTGISDLLKLTTLPTANAVRETANNAFGMLVIVQSASVDDSFIKSAKIAAAAIGALRVNWQTLNISCDDSFHLK